MINLKCAFRYSHVNFRNCFPAKAIHRDFENEKLPFIGKYQQLSARTHRDHVLHNFIKKLQLHKYLYKYGNIPITLQIYKKINNNKFFERCPYSTFFIQNI